MKTDEFKKKIGDLIDQMVVEELENNEEEYFLGTDDYGCYHNGVGFVVNGAHAVYDEEKARENVIEGIAESIREGKPESEPFCKLLADWIESYF